MMSRLISRLTHFPRISFPPAETAEDIEAFIDSRELEYPARLEDEFVQRALNLGVEGGMVLDVGTRVGLISLKILWQNENFYAIGTDTSTAMVERARQTATAWELGDRAFFQVGDVRNMRFKAGYFDLVVSDRTLHQFDDPASVLAEIRRVLKPKGALLIRDFLRPNRFRMTFQIEQSTSRFGLHMRSQLETAFRAAYTRSELERITAASGLEQIQIVEEEPELLVIQRRGETDPNSWVKLREKYI